MFAHRQKCVVVVRILHSDRQFCLQPATTVRNNCKVVRRRSCFFRLATAACNRRGYRNKCRRAANFWRLYSPQARKRTCSLQEVGGGRWEVGGEVGGVNNKYTVPRREAEHAMRHLQGNHRHSAAAFALGDLYESH